MKLSSPPPRKSRGIQSVLGALGAVASSVLMSPYAHVLSPQVGIALTAIGAVVAALSHPPRPGE